MSNEIDRLCEIYELVGFKRYGELSAFTSSLIDKNPGSEEIRFVRMEGQRVTDGRGAYYDCLAFKPSCSRAQIPNLSGAEGFAYEGTCGRKGIEGILNSERLRANHPADIRISKVTSHEDLFRVFIK